MCVKDDWERCVEFHGHACPGLAIGYRVAQVALAELAALRAADEELVAIVENDACGVDAIQVLTGCSIGKGNLIYRDYGKQVYTFVCRNSGQAVRVAIKAANWRVNPEVDALRQKVFAGTATEDEKAAFQRHQQERINNILSQPVEQLCDVRCIQIQPPAKARIFPSHICAVCGESVMEPRARVKQGRIVCIPCAEEYGRGW
ncbi:FmdE family protein [Desulfurispora thermophila]|uniref:FmdE family protein n=1 Tax=Desulfurispora thermophila TaxID=265470 RepID=UPI00036677ED|nr:FmdE family protein [Desulfurispora thermophila]